MLESVYSIIFMRLIFVTLETALIVVTHNIFNIKVTRHLHMFYQSINIWWMLQVQF